MTTTESVIKLLDCSYAFYAERQGERPIIQANCQRFSSASIIKIPILLAWVTLERCGELNRLETCDLDAEPQVQGAGYSWLLARRSIPYQDVLLMMIALSDNLCTNLVIRRIGIERLNEVIHGPLGLSKGTCLERKLMDYTARAQGKDNWVAPEDCARMFELVRGLTSQERAWIDPMFVVNQDNTLFLRDIPRDTLVFKHKTGSMPGVLHDWGWTEEVSLFLLTQGVRDETAANRVFGELGKMVLYPS